MGVVEDMLAKLRAKVLESERYAQLAADERARVDAALAEQAAYRPSSIVDQGIKAAGTVLAVTTAGVAIPLGAAASLAGPSTVVGGLGRDVVRNQVRGLAWNAATGAIIGGALTGIKGAPLVQAATGRLLDATGYGSDAGRGAPSPGAPGAVAAPPAPAPARLTFGAWLRSLFGGGR